MTSAAEKFVTISELARLARLDRREVATLIREHHIPRWERGNLTAIGPDGLVKLIPILLRYPGVDPAFASRL